MNGMTAEYEALRDRIRLSFVELAASCEIDAHLGEIDARLVESARSRLFESRELLARADTLLSTRIERCNKERSPPRDILRKAAESRAGALALSADMLREKAPREAGRVWRFGGNALGAMPPAD